MYLIFIILALLLLSLLIFTPLLWVGCGKILRIDNLTFRNAFITCIIASLVGVSIQAVEFALQATGAHNLFFSLILSLASLITVIWIIKKRLETTFLKVIGLYFLTIFFSVILALTIRTYLVQAFKIPSGAMLNTILIGDHILVNKYIYKFKLPSRGDIVVFKYPTNPKIDYIKRVVAVGGDAIEIINKEVYLNGVKINEDYIINKDNRILTGNMSQRDNFGPVKIPMNSYFVMGDNRDNSHDSRFWGVVEQSAIKGKAFVIYWSRDKDTKTNRLDRIGNSL